MYPPEMPCNLKDLNIEHQRTLIYFNSTVPLYLLAPRNLIKLIVVKDNLKG